MNGQNEIIIRKIDKSTPAWILAFFLRLLHRLDNIFNKRRKTKKEKMDEKQDASRSLGKKGIKRREFIQGLATLPILGLFTFSWLKKKSYDRSKEPSKPRRAIPESLSDIHVAFLGTGEQGYILLNDCLKLPGLRFKAVCDIWESYNQRRAAQVLKKYKHDVNTYTDYREMLSAERDLDAVIIATPDFWHTDHTVACLESNLHVYCEKEMSHTLEGARKMVEAARRTGKLLQIGHQRRSNPRYLHCYNNLIREAGLLGRITAVNGQWNRAVQPDIGWPKKHAIDIAVLNKYGYESMHQFRNWRWYKGLGGGPIVDLGSHQIDIFNWFLDAQPKSVLASGGTDYYSKDTHEWYDTVLAIYEYETGQGIVRANYQTLTTNSSEGYFENFLGDQGTLHISESANRGGVYREPSAPQWDKWVSRGYLSAPAKVTPQISTGAVLDVRETIGPDRHNIPVMFTDPYHLPHLANFFNAIRGFEKLNCPEDVGYETAVTVLKVNEAVERARRLDFIPEEFRA
jgi:predicted dehydrogenase